MPRHVLITGAAGQIATDFMRASAGRHSFTLLDLPGRFTAEHGRLGQLIEADLADLDAVKRACQGVDTVVHLGGFRKASAPWSDLLPANIVGTYNVVAAAIANRCRRVVFASSVHAVSGHRQHRQLREDDALCPPDLYGVTKCFGEALGSFAHTRHGLSFAALRIGAYQPAELLEAPDAGWMLAEYCAPEDLHQLIERVIDHPDIGFEIFNAGSANTYSRMAMDKAEDVLGFSPEADSYRRSPAFQAAFAAVGDLSQPVAPSGMRDDILGPA